MPLQFISMPLLCYSGLRQATATQCKSLQYPCNTTHFHSSPSLCRSSPSHRGSNRLCANLRRSQSTQCFSFAFLFHAQQSLSLASLSSALPLLFNSEYCISLPSRVNSSRLLSTALHIDAVRCHCFAILRFSSAMLCVSSPCLRCSTQVTSLPRNTAARLRILHYAAAFLCSANHCAAIAMQRYTLAANASV